MPKSEDKDQGNVVFGMSNDNFKAKGKEAANRVAEGVAVRAIGAVPGAAMGRVPILGPVIAGVATQMVAEEIRNRNKNASSEDLENKSGESEANQKNSTIDQSMYESAIDKLDNVELENKPDNVSVDDKKCESSDDDKGRGRLDSMDSMANIMDWEEKYDG